MNKEVSICCHADLRIVGAGDWDDNDATLYYECTCCHKACEAQLISDEIEV